MLRKSLPAICTSIAVTASSTMIGCAENIFEDIDGLFPTSGQRDVSLFNDSDMTAHLLVPGEARGPENRVLPGAGRNATIRATAGGALQLRAENSLGLNVQGTCTFADEVALQGGTITFTGSGFTCTGDLFQ